MANYPFATIEPNTGIVQVPDPRLDALAGIVSPERTVPAAVEFVDIAGLVKGASEGEGLGNQFLANIREVDAIVHVVRCFEDAGHPARHGRGRSGARPGGHQHRARAWPTWPAWRSGSTRPPAPPSRAIRRPSSSSGCWSRCARRWPPDEPGAGRRADRRGSGRPTAAFNLLTAKPVLYAANVAEDEIGGGNAYVERAARRARPRDGETAEVVTFSAKVEAELAELAPEDRAEFLESLGLTESGLDRLAHAAYHLLGLQSYFTAGEKEVRAWTIHRGDKAPAAAGVIHSDFEKGFIRAETVAYDDFVRVGGWKAAREQGLVAGGRQGIRRAGRRRDAVPLQH